jgi:hypothetical protein
MSISKTHEDRSPPHSIPLWLKSPGSVYVSCKKNIPLHLVLKYVNSQSCLFLSLTPLTFNVWIIVFPLLPLPVLYPCPFVSLYQQSHQCLEPCIFHSSFMLNTLRYATLATNLVLIVNWRLIELHILQNMSLELSDKRQKCKRGMRRVYCTQFKMCAT